MLSDFDVSDLNPNFPDITPGQTDLRWAARSDGKSGFVSFLESLICGANRLHA